MSTKDGAWIADATIAGGIDSDNNTHPLNCDSTGTLEVTGVVITTPTGTQTVAISQTGTDNDVNVTGTVSVTNFPASVEISNDVGNPIPVSGSLTTTPSGTQDVAVINIPHVIVDTVPATVATQATLATLNSNTALQYGTFGYYAGVVGTVNVTAGQRVLSISCHSTAGGTLAINGGASIPIPANVGFAINLLGNLVAPTIVYTGTDSYFVQVVS